MQLVRQLLFNRVVNWLWAGVYLYKAGHCSNDGVRPIQRVHDVILVSLVCFGPLGHVARKLGE